MSPYIERIEMVRSALSEWQIDGLLVSNVLNCRWLSGFTGSAGSLLITADKAVLATDSRYWEQAADQAPDYELFKHLRRPQDTAVFINSVGANRIGIEANQVTVQQAADLNQIEGITWQNLDYPLEPLRKRKTDEEIAVTRAAAAITDSAMAQIPLFVTPGISERELAWMLERQMRDEGAEGMAFAPIVAFGANSARPHHSPGERRLQVGEIVLVDMGARLDGYHSDLTRTFFFGDPPDGRFEEIYNAVLAAQTNALAGIRAATTTQEAHKIAADTIAAAGFGDYFGHGLGHGVGLEIHEAPFMSATRPPQPLGGSSLITVEPGIYLPGYGGVRIEDLALVTDEGTVVLSMSPKAPYLPLG